MNENRLPDYLDHMQQAAADACSFIDDLAGMTSKKTSARSRPSFMSLIIIGEAATKVMERCAEFAEQRAGVQPRNLIRFISKSRATRCI